jgi:hypothetical protein
MLVPPDPLAATLSATLVALTDKTIALIREGHAIDAIVFRNCVQPLYQAVDGAHESYTKTFLEYEHLIRTSANDGSWKTVFDRMEHDMILTTPQRVKIDALRLRIKAPELRPFRDSVGAYVRGAAKSHQLDKYANVPRLQLLAELDAILRPLGAPQPARVVAHAVNIIRRRSRSLHERYAVVTDEFESIRATQH